MRTAMRTSSHRTGFDRLTDAEMSHHIDVAYDALNRALVEAARHSPDFAFDGKPRYTLTRNCEETPRGHGVMFDAQEDKTYDVSVCFGGGQIQLRREYFEDVSDTTVAIKRSSTPGLMRSFLDFLKELKTPREAGRWSFGPETKTRLAMTA